MKLFRRLLVLLLMLCVLLNGCIALPDGQAPESETRKPTADRVIDTGDPNDPYRNMTATVFYSNYQPATSYEDAQWRSAHGFMSGSLEVPDQRPVTADNQPTENGLLVRNTSAIYSDNGNTYSIVDANGEIVIEIYRGGGYITLEEVAAYLLAFGEVPANYAENKKDNPGQSIWGIYLRLNHSYFSGNTQKYPYEPVLPDIRGCGGELSYYEVDIGTLGTDSDPDYRPRIYNNGASIARGAARIVYTRYDANGDRIIDVNEKFVFYTYNHYNDFQEYLNYYGGWGEIFGNITGGGSISSKTDYNPTSYVPTARRAFVSDGATVSYYYVYALPTYLLDRRYAEMYCA